MAVAIHDVPDLEDAARAFKEAEAEEAFWREHFDDLLARYPKQFVAVEDSAVIAAHDHLIDLMRLVEERGIEPRQVWVEYMSADPSDFMR